MPIIIIPYYTCSNNDKITHQHSTASCVAESITHIHKHYRCVYYVCMDVYIICMCGCVRNMYVCVDVYVIYMFVWHCMRIPVCTTHIALDVCAHTDPVYWSRLDVHCDFSSVRRGGCSWNVLDGQSAPEGPSLHQRLQIFDWNLNSRPVQIVVEGKG